MHACPILFVNKQVSMQRDGMQSSFLFGRNPSFESAWLLLLMPHHLKGPESILLQESA
jgi:hypothetical protein